MSIATKIVSKTRKKVRYLSGDILHAAGMRNNFYQSARGSRILVYHGVCKSNHLKFNTIFLTKKTFEAHLQFYSKYFNVVSLDDYYQQKFSNDKFNVCLTFDDGYANNYKYVLPLLQKHRLPATFFITGIGATGYDILWNDFLSIFSKYGPAKLIFNGDSYSKNRSNKYILNGDSISLNDKLRYTGFAEKAQMIKELYPLAPFKTDLSDEDYWQQMTTEQIKDLAQSPLVTIGSHGYYHNDLAKINPQDAARELSLTRHYLENLTGKEVKSIAFPYGSYNQAVINAAEQAAYTQLLATDFNNKADSENILLRERFTVNPFISVNNQMYATVTGRYER